MRIENNAVCTRVLRSNNDIQSRFRLLAPQERNGNGLIDPQNNTKASRALLGLAGHRATCVDRSAPEFTTAEHLVLHRLPPSKLKEPLRLDIEAEVSDSVCSCPCRTLFALMIAHVLQRAEKLFP